MSKDVNHLLKQKALLSFVEVSIYVVGWMEERLVGWFSLSFTIVNQVNFVNNFLAILLGPFLSEVEQSAIRRNENIQCILVIENFQVKVRGWRRYV